jgi:CRISPR-associated endonuclease/helicase Cas3
MFWGKLKGEIKLPLVHHCVDVAMVLRVLVELPIIRRRLEAAAKLRLNDTHLDRLAVIALFHDLGKANLGFQDKPFDDNAPRAGHIRELAPLFFEPSLTEAFIEALDIETLRSWFDPPHALDSFLIAAWSHHGTPVRFDSADRTGNYFLAKTKWWRPDKNRDPFAEIAAISKAAHDSFQAAYCGDMAKLPESAPLQHRFAGLLMLADWIASHESFFSIDRDTDKPFTFARDSAQRAIRVIGLESTAFQNHLSTRPAGFFQYFGFEPRPLQAAIDCLPVAENKNRLLIAEAETGAGKTEAALTRFFRLFAAGEVDSLYFALPTRVAARELYTRVCRYVDRIFSVKENRPHVLLAVPGYSKVDDVPVEKILPHDKTRWHDDPKQVLQESFWAAEHPKRFLAATIAVGTIDQALLSALQTRHSHLRSVCLDRSLLVVDEVHASDPYMRRLLKGLLGHHIGLGGHALLLSATLGARAKVELVKAAGGKAELPDFNTACEVCYPAYTDLTGATCPVKLNPVEDGKLVRFKLRPYMAQPEALLDEIAKALAQGARILVILNTVDRVITFQRNVEVKLAAESQAFFRCNEVVSPHHGRYAPTDRELLDKAVSSRLGKDSLPGPVLLIGTQTLEQSLDIDADLLITDICPADVLLQRVGRLHRHRRNRPSVYKTATCLVLVPEHGNMKMLLNEEGKVSITAKRAGLGSVYEDLRCVELTRRLLIENQEVNLPRDNRQFVEGVTHPDSLANLTGTRWQMHAQMVDGVALAKEISAHYAAAIYDQPFGEFSFSELNVNARTRLGLNSLRVPLKKPVDGPFGQKLREILIPGHLAPESIDEDKAIVRDIRDGVTLIAWADRNYCYSRIGLERDNEPIE